MPNLFVYALLLFARVATFVGILPMLGSQVMPRLVRIGLALALTVMWGTSLPADSRTLEWLGQQSEMSWFALGLALGKEAFFGAMLSFALGLFLVPARITGEYLTQELGLNFGSFLNPGGGTTGGSLVQIFELFAVMIFLLMDGHHLFLAIFDHTLARYPVGVAVPQPPIQNVTASVATVEEWGVMLAAPIALGLFLTTVILALMARVAPQMNIFAVGFALRLVVGLVLLFLLVPNFVAALITVLGQSTGLVRNLL